MGFFFVVFFLKNSDLEILDHLTLSSLKAGILSY